MNIEDLKTLSLIYNTLLEISTKGDDTVLMGECLKAFKNFIMNKQEEVQKEESK